MNEHTTLEFGLYTLGDYLTSADDQESMTEHQRIQNMLDMAVASEKAGLDVFGVGESHQELFVASSPQMILATIAGVTEKIKLLSASTVLSPLDPVRVYEDFATLDLLSKGRAEITAGRGSRYGAYKLFGYDLANYDELFEEKFDLLLQLNQKQPITWTGEFRSSLEEVELYPKPFKGKLPIWRAVGQHIASAIQAGTMAVPMQLAALYGASSIFQKRVDAYRQAAHEAGHNSKDLPIGLATMMFIEEDGEQAYRNYYPYLNNTFKQIRGVDFPKQHYAQAKDPKNSIMVGSPQEIAEKIIYQYKLFGHQRFLAQIDHGNIPHDHVMKTIDLFANEVIPTVNNAINIKERN